jgi:hypothetical protein
LESSYKDDHFDLTLREHLLGKTLAKFSAYGVLSDTAEVPMVRTSLELLGWTLFEKWDKVVGLCNNNNNIKSPLDEDCIRQAQSLAEESSSGDESLRLKAAESLGKLSSADFDVKGFLEAEVEKSAKQNEAKIIQVQFCQMFSFASFGS